MKKINIEKNSNKKLPLSVFYFYASDILKTFPIVTKENIIQEVQTRTIRYTPFYKPISKILQVPFKQDKTENQK